MKLKADSTEQKLRGGYYTPGVIADFIVNWALNNKEDNTSIIEPSCGDGVFLESLLKHSDDIVSCIAVELLSDEAKTCQSKIKGKSNYRVINDDFYHIYENALKNRKFDLVVGNPPYIRYQYLTAEQRKTQARILVSNGLKENKLINSWVSFLVGCVDLLNDNGKIGMVIPAEILQVAYAKDLRLFLSDNLSKITIITFEELVFPGVQQEVVLLLGEKNSSVAENRISIVQLKNLECLMTTDLEYEYKQMDHNRDKWTKYFLTNDEIRLINKVQTNERFLKFKEIADVDIGITTGDNKFFSVTEDIVQEYGLQDAVLPLIGRSAHSKGIYFNEKDWKENVNDGLRAQLVNFPDIPYEQYPNGYKDYIKHGELLEIHKGYKCSIRPRWYRIPSIWIPDAFFLRRNNGFPKFVLNRTDAVSTDTMHRIKFKGSINEERALLSYYNSVTFAFTEIEGRSYGGGVLEILPGEVENIIIPDISELEDDVVDYFIHKIDITIRNNKPIEPILDEIDKRILVDFMGFSYREVLQFRDIWKKLMNRRHIRKKKIL